MSDYEIIGRITIFMGVVILGIGALILTQKLAWFAFKELVGWPRIVKALRLLQKAEVKTERNAEDMT